MVEPLPINIKKSPSIGGHAGDFFNKCINVSFDKKNKFT